MRVPATKKREPFPLSRMVGWALAGTVTVLLTVLFFCPAAILAQQVEKLSGGQLALGDAQGTLWQGSAIIGGAASKDAPVTPLLPGRFVWHLSPLVLIGKVELQLANPEALSSPVSLTGDWEQWSLSRSSIMLPAERLASLGAPLNSIRPSGQMRLSWSELALKRRGEQVEVSGSTVLELNNIGSAILPGKPLGAYKVAIDWRGQQGDLNLSTVTGPLLLNGSGHFQGGHFEFNGRAEAQAGDKDEESRLANLLNIMGQRRTEGNKNFIALEFRQ